MIRKQRIYVVYGDNGKRICTFESLRLAKKFMTAYIRIKAEHESPWQKKDPPQGKYAHLKY